jgi:hypothetical protein
MNTNKILAREDRIEIIEDICSKFHEDGIKHLSVVGHFQKYTPLFHFNISEEISDSPFIFITELFGNEKYTTKLLSPHMQRAQYHGDYDGLYGIVLQGINTISDGPLPSMCKFNERPNLTIDTQKDFDNALIYIRDKLHYFSPELIKSNDSEFIQHTYHFF